MNIGALPCLGCGDDIPLRLATSSMPATPKSQPARHFDAVQMQSRFVEKRCA
jgi:hypothetical protein